MTTKTENGEKKMAPATTEAITPWTSMEQMMRAFDKMWTPWFNFERFPKLPDMPALNVHKKNGDLLVEAALPGMSKKDIKVNVTGRVLTIEGEHREEKKVDEKDRYLSEIKRGSVFRQIQLPAEVNPSKVKAEYKDGVLHLTMPMTEPERHNGVNISVS
jgi:HSP20 family protein